MTTICPFCDSANVEKIMSNTTIKIPFSDDVCIPYPTFKCNNCEEEGDFDNSLDKELTTAIDNAHFQSAPKIIDELNKNGITMVSMERVLRLPFGTITKWKTGQISYAGITLLRLIRFCPELLIVADENFCT